MVRSNMIVNFPVTFDDIKNTKLIFGPDITSVKGKALRHKPAIIPLDYVKIPQKILESRKHLEVSTDIIFIDKNLFLVRIIRGLKFTTIEYLFSKNYIVLVTSFNKIVSYKNHTVYM